MLNEGMKIFTECAVNMCILILYDASYDIQVNSMRYFNGKRMRIDNDM